MGLGKRKIDLLREFVNKECEECNKSEDIVGKLTPHRIKRGVNGGIYCLRNIKMVCKDCHKKYHQSEFR